MKMIRKIPRYAILPAILLIMVQMAAYYGSQILTKNVDPYDFTIHGLDDAVPLVTFFIVFYILSYPWWFISPLIVANTNRQRFFNWTFALMICYVISAFIFVLVPTTIQRPVIGNVNVFDQLTNYIYDHDSPGRAINLFPSLHCLISWFCFIGVRKQKNIAPWYRWSAFIFALLICLSTQFVKQHYLVDLIGGIMLSETVFYIVNRFNLGNIFDKNHIEENENGN